MACRKARKQLENGGHRTEADHNFFMEMEAKRRQNGITKLVHIDKARLAPTSMNELRSILWEDIKKLNYSSVSSVYKFFKYNLFETIAFRHIFGGYGIFWEWIIFWWLSFAILFGLIYRFYFHGIDGASCLLQCVYFSILVAFTRQFGGYQLSLSTITGEDIVVVFETILGLVLLGLFVASITRRYMR